MNLLTVYVNVSMSYVLQISDIMVGQEENLTAKEALLRWARITTHKYPSVDVKNFTTSWRDGLAFVAIIHRNRQVVLLHMLFLHHFCGTTAAIRTRTLELPLQCCVVDTVCGQLVALSHECNWSL